MILIIMRGSGTNGRAQLDRSELRRALGSFLTGVTIITAHDAEGHPRGITANSFTSVSLDPPLVLVCVDRRAASYDTFAQCGGFVVHILAADQQDLSARFASKSPDKFADLRVRVGSGGGPILPRSNAWLDCRTERQIDVGDHVLVIGEVLAFGLQEQRPLGYHQGKYVSLRPEQDGAALTRDDGAALRAAWIAETVDGALVLEAEGSGWSVPQVPFDHGRLDDAQLTAAATASLGVKTEVAFLYSIFDCPRTQTLLMAYRLRVDAAAEQMSTAAPELRCFPVHAIPWDRIPDSSIAAMLRRYVRERAGEQFGLYAGSAASGRVAALAGIDRA